MERFVRLIVGGGLALVAGLWLVALLNPPSARIVGVTLALIGTGCVLVGIRSRLDP